MNFSQPSYEVMEDQGEVMIMIVLSQPSSEPFKVMISLINDTANGEWYTFHYNKTSFMWISDNMLHLQKFKVEMYQYQHQYWYWYRYQWY